MIIEKQIVINNSIENTWMILGHDFAHAYKWASAVEHSEGTGTNKFGSHCDERACTTVLGNLREKLTHYSDQDYNLSYVVAEGMPAAVKSATTNWH